MARAISFQGRGLPALWWVILLRSHILNQIFFHLKNSKSMSEMQFFTHLHFSHWWMLSGQHRSPDTLFYESPRFVTHIDDPAIAALTKYYSEVLPPSNTPGVAILDMCSSWVSYEFIFILLLSNQNCLHWH